MGDTKPAGGARGEETKVVGRLQNPRFRADTAPQLSPAQKWDISLCYQLWEINNLYNHGHPREQGK